MNRRGFLSAVLSAAVSPSIVKATSLMKIYVPRDAKKLVLYGDGIHDDSDAFQAFMDGKDVFIMRNGVLLPAFSALDGMDIRLTRTINVSDCFTNRSVCCSKLFWDKPVDVGINITRHADKNV